MQNEAQYDLGRKAAKISALFSNNLDKYEYFAGEDLDLKPSTIEQSRFEYSAQGKFFNKRLTEECEKEGLLKRLKAIEDKNEEQLKAITGKTDIKSKTDLFDEDLIQEVIALIKEIKSIEENVDYNKLSFTGGNKKVYDLDSSKTFEKSIKDIFSKNMTIDEAEIKQKKFDEQVDELKDYPTRVSKYIDLKKSASKNVKNFHDEWEKIVNAFKNKIMPLSKKIDEKTDRDDQQPDILDASEQKRFNDFLSQIKEEKRNKDMALFKGVFGYEMSVQMLQTLHKLKRADIYKKKGKQNLQKFFIEDTVLSFVERVKKMPEGVEKNEGKKMLKIVSKILDFNLNEQKQRR